MNRFPSRYLLDAANRGLTLAEVIVGGVVGIAVISVALAGTVANRELFARDAAATEANSRVRAALDLPGLDIRQIGENLGTVNGFPALQVTRSQSDANSRMILRRNPLVALRSCEAPVGNRVTVALQVTFDDGNNDFSAGPVNDPARSDNPAIAAAFDAAMQPNCAVPPTLGVSGLPTNLELWRNYRLANGPRPTQAYLYADANGGATLGAATPEQGEFFVHTGEAAEVTAFTLTGAGAGRTGQIRRFVIQRNATPWPAWAAARQMLYLVETRDYQVINNNLQVVVNGNAAEPQMLLTGIEQFQVRVNRQPGRTAGTINGDFCWQYANDVAVLSATPVAALVPPTACDTTVNLHNSWGSIQSIDVSVTSQTVGFNPTAGSALSKRFFPRSVMSF